MARRPLRIAVRVLLGLAAVLVAASAALLVALHVPRWSTPLANAVLERVPGPPGTVQQVAWFRLTGLGGVEARGFRLSRGDTLLLGADRFHARIRPGALLRGHIHLTRLDVAGARASPALLAPPPGRRPRSAPSMNLTPAAILQGDFYSGPPVRADRVHLDGALAGPVPSGDLEIMLRLDGRDIHLGDGFGFEIDSLRVLGPASRISGHARLAPGTGGVPGPVEIDLGLAPFALADLSRIAPRLPMRGSLDGEIALRGSDPRRISGAVRLDADSLRIGADAYGPLHLEADVVDGRAGLRSSARYRGARLDLDGWVRPLARVPEYDLNLDLDRLPRGLPGLGEQVPEARARAHVAGSGFWPVDAAIDGAVTSSAGSLDFRGGLRAPDLVWTLEHLDVRDLDVARWAGDTTASRVTASFRAAGRGTTPESLQASVSWRLESSHYGPWEIDSGSGRAGLDGRNLGASFRLAAYGGLLAADTLRVALDGTGKFEIPSLRWKDLDPARLTGNGNLPHDLSGTLGLRGNALERRVAFDAGFRAEGEAVRLGGSLRGQARLAPPAPGARPGLPGIAGSVVLQLDPSRLGAWNLSGGALDLTLAGERFEAHGALAMDSTEVRLETDGTLTEAGIEARLGCEVPLAFLVALAGLDSLETRGGLRLDATCSGAGPRGARVSAQLRGSGQLGDWRLDAITLLAGLDRGTVTVDSLALRSNAGTVTGAGTLALADSTGGPGTELRLDLALTDPAPLRPLAGADTLGLSRGALSVRLTGPRSGPSFAADGSLESLVWNEVHLDTARVEAAGSLGPGWRPLSASATVSLTRLGRPTTVLERATADLRYRPRALDFDLAARMDPDHRARLAGRAAGDAGELTVGLDRVDLESPESTWHLVRPATIHRGPDRLAFDSVEVRADSGRVTVTGGLDRRGSQDLRATAEHVELDVISRWFGRDDLNGRLDGELEITGPAEAPHAAGSLRLAATEEGEAVGVFDTRLDWRGAEARVTAAFVSPARDSVTVVALLPATLSLAPADPDRAEVPVPAPDRETQLIVSADRFPLAALQPLFSPSTVASLQGRLDADLRLSGRGTDLSGSGGIRLTGAEIALGTVGTTYRDVEVVAELEGDRLALRTAKAKSGKGEATLSGGILVAGPTDIRPDLTLAADDFLFVDNEEIRLRASGKLGIEGSLTAPVVRGRITARGSQYTLTPEVLAGFQASSRVELTPADVRMMEAAFGPQGPRGPSPIAKAMDASDLDLQVSLGRDNWVRKRGSPRLGVEIQGDVHVLKSPGGEMLLEGKVAPVPGRGYIEEFGRTFEFSGGEILLNGPAEDHDVDIEAEYKVRNPGEGEAEVVIHLNVHGRLDDLKLELSSDPPLSETEIVSYIGTGGGSSGSGQAQGADAMALAAGVGLSQVTGALGEAVQGKVGLDVLQVRYDPQQGATVVAGRYLGPLLYVGVRQPVQYQEKSDTSSQNPYQTLVELEYEATRWLILNLQGETSRVRGSIRARHEY